MKILVVRFSSIGDIVLTSPVVRALREQLESVEIHFLTKEPYKELVHNNPNIDRVITIANSINEVISELKTENYDHIVDLHNNIRTRGLKLKLRRNMSSFPKLNYEKWVLVRFKRNKLPDTHVVDRYFEAVKVLGVENRSTAVEFNISPNNKVNTVEVFGLEPKSYVVIVVGAKFNTKRIPEEKVRALIDGCESPVVLIGGPDDREMAENIINKTTNRSVVNAAGAFTIQQSASIIKQSKKVVTADTGMMHIASAFDVPIISIWGNTVPELGMYPYRPQAKDSFSIHEVKGLSCRPCSKIGYDKCPKGHFKCMNDQDYKGITNEINA